jgi:hypothetical protein
MSSCTASACQTPEIKEESSLVPVSQSAVSIDLVAMGSVDAAAPSSQARREIEEVTKFFVSTIENRSSTRLAAGVE